MTDFSSGIAPPIHQSGPLAQSVERRADNAKVMSSSLIRTIFFFFSHTKIFFFLPLYCEYFFQPNHSNYFQINFDNYSFFYSILQENRDQAVDLVSF